MHGWERSLVDPGLGNQMGVWSERVASLRLRGSPGSTGRAEGGATQRPALWFGGAFFSLPFQVLRRSQSDATKAQKAGWVQKNTPPPHPARAPLNLSLRQRGLPTRKSKRVWSPLKSLCQASVKGAAAALEEWSCSHWTRSLCLNLQSPFG